MVAAWAVVVAQVAAAIIAITWRGVPSDQDIRLLVPPVLLVIPFHIAAYLACCLWLSQARANAEVLNPRARHALRKGWVWGGWICPIVLLWFPYVLVRDVARATGSTGSPTPKVGWWWAMFLVYFFATNSIERSAPTTTSAWESAHTSLGPIYAFAAAVSIVAATLWVSVVGRIQQAQKQYAATARA